MEGARKPRSKFLPRLLKFRHLEFDSALQQVIWTVACPKRVFRYHQDQNAMRGYWARDDPAFLLLLCLFMTVSAVVYALWLRLSIGGIFVAWLWTLLGDLLGAGVTVATGMWILANHVLVKPHSGHRVEWAYCFDVHLNAFCPLALGIYGLQPLLWPLLSQSYFLSTVGANSLWLVCVGYYIYITFLGYAVLTPSRNTMALLYAVLPPMFLYVLTLPLGWNLASAFGTWFAWRTGTRP